jgi:hypothetical protein
MTSFFGLHIAMVGLAILSFGLVARGLPPAQLCNQTPSLYTPEHIKEHCGKLQGHLFSEWLCVTRPE